MPPKKRHAIKDPTPNIEYVNSPEFTIFSYPDTDEKENVSKRKRKPSYKFRSHSKCTSKTVTKHVCQDESVTKDIQPTIDMTVESSHAYGECSNSKDGELAVENPIENCVEKECSNAATNLASVSSEKNDTCPVCCEVFLATETVENKTAHINQCLDTNSRNETQSDELLAQNLHRQSLQEILLDDATYICTVCMKNLTTWDINRRQMHMNHCVNTTLEGRQLRGEKKSSNIVGQTCPMCGVKMSKEKFASHVRKCAKSLKYSDQQLMKILQTQGISTEQRSNKMSAAQRKKHFKSNIKKGQLSTIIKPRDKEATNEHIKTQAKSILTESTSAHHILSTPPSTPAMKKSLIGKMNATEETSSHTSVNEAPQKPNHTVALIKDSGCKLWNLSSFDMKTNRTNFLVSALKDKLGVQPSLQSENEIQQNVVQIADESFTDTQCDKLDILMALNSSIEQKKNDNGFIFDNTEDKLSELHKQSNQKLLEDFTALLQESVPYDFTFHCKDGVNVSCHKFMLVTRCHTFREIILNGEDDAIVSDISSAAVNAFINYIYCGAVNFLHVLDEVYVLANRYNLDFLTQACIFLKPTLHDKNDTSHNSQQSTDVDKLVSTFWKKKEFDNDAKVNELEKSWGILQNIKEDNDVGGDSSFSENELALMKEVFQTQAQLENSINKENVDDDTTSQADFESTVMLNGKQQSDSPKSTVNVLVPDSFEISPVSTSKDNFAQVGCSPVQSDAYQHDKHISSYEDDHCENAPQVEVIEVHGSPSETAVDKMEKSMDYISPSATPIPLSCETPAINTPLCVRDRRQDDKVATPLRELSYDDTTVVKESNENSEIEVLSLNNTAIFKTTGTTKHAGESLANPQDICEYTTQRNSAYSVSKIDENTGFSVAPAYQSDKKFSGNKTSGSGVSPSYVESPCVIRKSEIVSSTPNLCTSNQINSSFGNKDINHSAIAKSSSEKRNMISVVLDYCSEKEGKTREKKLSSTQTNTPFLLEKQMTRKRLHEFSSTESISSDEDGYDRFKQREKKKLKRSNKRDNNEMKKSQLSSINVTSSDEHVSENEVVETDNFVCTNISPARLKSTSTPSGRLNKRKSRSPYSPVVTPSQWLSTSDRRLSTEKKKKCSSVKPNNGNKKKKNSFKDLVKEVANEVSSTSVESISSSSGECTNEQEKNEVSNLYERTVPNDSGEKFDSSNTNKQISDENQHLPSSQTGFKPDDGSVSMPENEYSIYYMDDGGYNSFTIEPGTVDEDQNIHGSIVVENQTKPGENTSINLDTAKQRKESIPDENDNVTKVDLPNQTEKDNNLALIANIKSLKAFTSDEFLEPFQIDSVKDDCSKSSGNVNNNASFDNATHSRDNDSIPNIDFENDSFAAYCMTNNDVASTSGTKNKNAKMVERNTATPVGIKNTATFKTPICTSIAAKNFPAGCDRHPETNEPITPMPDYSNYPTPQLQEEIKKYALRDMAKPKMIAKMKEVYKFQHNFTNWEEEPCKNVKRKPRKKKEANNPNEENKTTDEKEEKESGKNRKKVATKTEENTEGPSTHEMLNNLIKSDRSLHTKILSYEPLEFSEVLSLIVANSIKCSKKMLEKYLDEQCICYYSAKDESQKPRTRNQRKKKK